MFISEHPILGALLCIAAFVVVIKLIGLFLKLITKHFVKTILVIGIIYIICVACYLSFSGRTLRDGLLILGRRILECVLLIGVPALLHFGAIWFKFKDNVPSARLSSYFVELIASLFICCAVIVSQEKDYITIIMSFINKFSDFANWLYGSIEFALPVFVSERHTYFFIVFLILGVILMVLDVIYYKITPVSLMKSLLCGVTGIAVWLVFILYVFIPVIAFSAALAVGSVFIFLIVCGMGGFNLSTSSRKTYIDPSTGEVYIQNDDYDKSYVQNDDYGDSGKKINYLKNSADEDVFLNVDAHGLMTGRDSHGNDVSLHEWNDDYLEDDDGNLYRKY